MFSYFAYGLGIRSNFLLPDLVPAEAGGDVEIVVTRGAAGGEVDETAPTADSRVVRRALTATEFRFSLYHVGEVRVRDGREVSIACLPEADTRSLQHLIAGNLLALILRQRKRVVLHASAVEIDSAGIVFAGDSGQGKSTMAAAMNVRGHRIVADDVAAVEVSEDGCRLFRAFPQLKVSPEAARWLAFDPEDLPRAHPDGDERIYRTNGEFPRAPLPLRAVYVMEEGAEAAIERLPRREAVAELLRHSYAVRSIEPDVDRGAYFLRSGRLAASIPVYRLRRPKSLAALPELARTVEAHALDQWRAD